MVTGPRRRARCTPAAIAGTDPAARPHRFGRHPIAGVLRARLIWRLVCQAGVGDRVRLAGWVWRVGRWVGAPGAVLGVASLSCEGWVPQRPGLLLPASAV
jgi:hypothetical protein